VEAWLGHLDREDPDRRRQQRVGAALEIAR
jgi:hypothetical protein